MENQLTISIIGYGNQAKAWALNLRDSGVKVRIGLRKKSANIELATSHGFEVFELNQNTKISTKICAVLTPDDTHLDILKSLESSDTVFVFAHGFSVVAENLKEKFPNFNFALLAPKAIASELRFRYETKESLAAFYSTEYCDHDFENELKELGKLLGINNLYPTSFQDETQADLFSEQTLLCSILPYTINLAFKTLVERGYQKELAFYECFVEAKLIVDTILKVGPEAFFDFISPNALVGSEKGRKLLLDSEFEEKFKSLLDEVRTSHHLEELKSADVNTVRKNVNLFWKDQALNQTFQDLKDTL